MTKSELAAQENVTVKTLSNWIKKSVAQGYLNITLEQWRGCRVIPSAMLQELKKVFVLYREIRSLLNTPLMASIEITLPKAQFDELALLVSCETLASKGQAKGIERLRGKQVVVVASYGTAERGVIELTAYSVVPLALFTGKTRTHRDKWPEPSYAGMVFRFNGKSFVFTPDRYTIKVSDAGSGQLNLF